MIIEEPLSKPQKMCSLLRFSFGGIATLNFEMLNNYGKQPLSKGRLCLTGYGKLTIAHSLDIRLMGYVFPPKQQGILHQYGAKGFTGKEEVFHCKKVD